MKDDPDRVLDEYLVVLAQGGSPEALDRLTRRWTPRLLRYAARTAGNPELAGDIVQETWLGAIRGLKRLTDPARFPAWIYGIARRKCVDLIRINQHLRRQTVREQADLDANTANTVGGPSSDAIDLAAAIAQLSEEQRDVVHLFYGEDLSVQEIAEVLALPSGTVKSRLHHAREKLKATLGE